MSVVIATDPTEQFFLRVDLLCSGNDGDANVGSVHQHFARFDVVFQVQLQNAVMQVPHQPAIFDWKQHLDAAVEISRHKVGAPDVNQFIASVVEVVDAAVLQETSHDASNANVLADVRKIRTQAAHSAH